MTEIISVRFKEGGKDYYFNPNGVQYKPGDRVIIETARGVEFGECTKGNSLIDEMTLVSPLRPVLRRATPEDEKRVARNKQKEKEAFSICEQKILDHNLDMKLVEVEYNFDGSKILFFFTSDGRVDFRELVRDLAGIFHTRIELRQIGVRDEAKLLGGLGTCGRPFCCSSFLDDFQPVSIKMAKTQSLSLNPAKISGACGRLMCCLKYEQDAYEDALKRCPKNDSLVETPDGVGTICAVNLLRETARVRLDNAPDTQETYPCEDLKVIRSGKGKRPEGYELPEKPEKAERPQRQLKDSLAAPAAEEKPAPQERPRPKKKQPPREAAPQQGQQAQEAPKSRPKKNPPKKRPPKQEKQAAPQEGKQDGSAQAKAPQSPAQGGEAKRPPKRNNYHRNHHKKRPQGEGAPAAKGE